MVLKEEIKNLLKNYLKENVEFGKDESYLCFRNDCSKEDFFEEIFSLNNFEYAVKQMKDGEERYALYYVYSKKKGRVYVLRFYPEKIRVITIFTIGRRTLNKYSKRRFKNKR